MRIGSLFSGAGGLDMAVEAVFGGEVVWQAEIDKAASKVLAYRFPTARNLGDITAIDWDTVERVPLPGRERGGQAGRHQGWHPQWPLGDLRRSHRRAATAVRRD